MRIISFIFLIAASINIYGQHNLMIVGSGDSTKVKLIEFDDDRTRTTVFGFMSEDRAAIVHDSLSVRYSALDIDLDEELIQVISEIEMIEADLKDRRKQKRRLIRRIAIRNAQ